MYKFNKRDGSQEDFNRNKIVNGVIKAGGTPEEAEKVASEIELWLPTAVLDNVITSSQVRGKVLEVLKTVNLNVATSFETYSKPSPTENPVPSQE